MLRGSRDFDGRDEYVSFLRGLFGQLNKGRQKRLDEELPLLRSLPRSRIESAKRLQVRVDRGSTVHVQGNTYSVPSRLIGEWVEVRLFAEHVEVHYAQKPLQRMPRLRGKGKHKIDYRHVIDALVRKPKAFADYRYRAEMFPTARFRWAYDKLTEQSPRRADREYLKILHTAAREGETMVEAALVRLMDRQQTLGAAAVEAELRRHSDTQTSVASATVGAVDLSLYDSLLSDKEVEDESGRVGREGGAGGAAEGAAPAGVPGRL